MVDTNIDEESVETGVVKNTRTSGTGSTSESQGSSFNASRHSSKSKSSKSQGSQQLTVQVPIDRASLELAISEHNNQNEEEDASKNRSYLFLFVCCDIRLGCILSNAFYILAIALISAFEWRVIEEVPEDQEDALQAAKELSYLRNGLTMGFALLGGIGGAWLFQKYLVLLTTIWFVAFLVWGIVIGTRLSLMGSIFMIYPNGHLFWALQTGKISKENYATVKRGFC